jgi:hypothetical protein
VDYLATPRFRRAGPDALVAAGYTAGSGGQHLLLDSGLTGGDTWPAPQGIRPMSYPTRGSSPPLTPPTTLPCAHPPFRLIFAMALTFYLLYALAGSVVNPCAGVPQPVPRPHAFSGIYLALAFPPAPHADRANRG